MYLISHHSLTLESIVDQPKTFIIISEIIMNPMKIQLIFCNSYIYVNFDLTDTKAEY